MEELFDTEEMGTMEFEDKLHWYNAQKKWLKKREFWRAVIYALTRPEEYKPILLKKALDSKDLCDTILEEIADYGEENGFVSKPRNKKKGA